MPRTGRKKSASGIYHILLRGINRQTIFEEEEDAIKYLETLKNYQDKSGYKLYAYCLMGNHIHLLLKEEKEELGIIMRRIGASYVYWYNDKYNRCGHLFQDRYKSETVEDDRYLLAVLRYIHQNPLKAELVKNIVDYKWSSYCEYIKNDEIIDTDFILELFGEERKKAIESFKLFHEESKNERCIDINEKKKISDSEAIEMIKRVCIVSHCMDVQRIEKEQKNKCLSLLKENGLSTRQIARLTGVGRSIVLKA
ncbi:REP element-mobilizing transposase RayT [Anaerovirgula multivorans]|uniref:REP element-mobilizing transposase RayT n=1 Tax=Anaerovirgula multivorans TaxID=312168 RepID=A0A239FYC6_9FIRM|nr:transposase [Anaerovirgula multivorans]SNS61921.1 REP element-mobilizing transposase RayT [Anaerovirgula multivorans]